MSSTKEETLRNKHVARTRPFVSPAATRRWVGAAVTLMFVSVTPLPVTHAAAASAHAFTTGDCTSLSTLSLPDTVVTAATLIPATGSLPAYCRVLATVLPETDIEVRLPDAWQARLLHLGGAGLDGAIPNLDASNSRLRQGYALAASNGGHRDPTRGPTRFLGDPTLIDDYAHGAIAKTVVFSKAIIQAYYGERPTYSYFEGCSSGGRSAFNAAAKYASEYDGIVAAAPTRNMVGAISAWADASQQHAPSVAKLTFMYQAQVAHCDAQDGLLDGIIGNAAQCRFDVATLRCPEGVDTDSCLTDDEIGAVTAIRNPLTSANRNTVYPGFGIGNPGTGFGVFMPVGPPGSPTFSSFLSSAFLSFIVYGDPSYDPATFDVVDDAAAIENVLEQVYDFSAEALPLARYLRSGKKLIVWHGAEDTLLSHLDSIRSFEEMVSAAGSYRENARLYVPPGVNHCFGGPGADRFDMVGALSAWVESGDPPDTLSASKVDAAGNVLFTRPLCEYPRYPRYIGGPPTDASSFRCVGPGNHGKP
jgi:feruloyl esterase